VLYEEDSVQTVIVAELVVDQPAVPSPAVPATAVAQKTQETSLAEAEADEVVAEHHTDTLRRGAIALGIAGIVWGSLAGIIGIKPVAIATMIAIVLACFALIYRVCFQEVPVEEID
jgi:hypothetical protein